MRRRDFLSVSAVTVMLPQNIVAQPRAQQHRIAMFHPAIPTRLLTETGGGSAWRAFFSELRRLGYVEGGNLIIERYSAEGDHSRYQGMAAEIVSRSPDAIVTGTNPVVAVFAKTTKTIPLVTFMIDPLKAGLLTSLARPGGNLTGITLDGGLEIWGKRLELLKEAIPSTQRAVFLGMRDGWAGSSEQALRDAAARLGIALSFTFPSEGTRGEIERVFAAIADEQPDAVLVSGEGDLYAHLKLVAELAVKRRLPSLSPYRDYVEAGGLMAYTVDLAELLRHMAGEVHQILRGEKPGDIPVYQPTKFDLIVNVRTADNLGLSIPRPLLARADEVIE